MITPTLNNASAALGILDTASPPWRNNTLRRLFTFVIKQLPQPVIGIRLIRRVRVTLHPRLQRSDGLIVLFFLQNERNSSIVIAVSIATLNRRTAAGRGRTCIVARCRSARSRIVTGTRGRLTGIAAVIAAQTVDLLIDLLLALNNLIQLIGILLDFPRNESISRWLSLICCCSCCISCAWALEILSRLVTRSSTEPEPTLLIDAWA